MKLPDWAELFALAALWGGSFLFMRMAVPEFGPIALIAVRVGVAAVFLLVVLGWQRQWPLLGRHVGALVVVGVTNSALPFCLFAYATLSVGAGEAAILNATSPLWAVAVARIWLGTRVPAVRWIGALLGLCGVAVLFWGKVAFTGERQTWAVPAALAAALSYGVAANYSRQRLAATPPLVVATGSQLAAALCLLPLCGWAWPAAAVSPRGWAAALVMGVACTGVAYILYFRLISRLGASRAISVTFLVPLFALAWGRLALHELITAQTVFGCALVLLGTALTTAAPLRSRWPWRRAGRPA
jgi:drug/metabolite transporter (DMT)-like permease